MPKLVRSILQCGVLVLAALSAAPCGDAGLRPRASANVAMAGENAGSMSGLRRAGAPVACGLVPGAANEGRERYLGPGIALQEYRACVEDSGLQAPNRAHAFRTWFRVDGIEVVPRAAQTAPRWRFVWTTTRWGRDAAYTALGGSGTPIVVGDRVIYDWGGLLEWYKNGPDGLEQGFTVAARPPGRDRLRIEGRVTGSLRLQLEETDETIVLLDDQGECRLRYGGLWVKDAMQTEIPSRLAVDGEQVALLIDDSDAIYPLTIDPLLTSPSWTAEGGQPDAYFGHSVLTSGDVNGDGYSDVIVGAPGFDGGEVDEGRAWLYLGSPTGLSPNPSWTVAGGQAGAGLGASVGAAGDLNGDGYADVIVGAPGYSDGEAGEGRALVFLGSPGGLTASPAWMIDGEQVEAALGEALGMAGDVNGDGYGDVIIGVPGYAGAGTDAGEVLLFFGCASGLSSLPGWTEEGDQAGARFGAAVGGAGDVDGDGYADIIIGAPGHDHGQTDEGRAFVYRGSPSGPSGSALWTGESDQEGARYGCAVSTAGDVNGDGYADVIVGADRYDNGQLDEGRAFLYGGTASGPAADASWTAEGNQVSAAFGAAVATAGDENGDGWADVIVGAAQYDNGQSDEGRAFLYQGSRSGLPIGPSWTAESNQAGALFGSAVGTAGDVNGDGLSDVIVGADRLDSGSSDEGRAFVYHGVTGALGQIPSWTYLGDQQNGTFGQSVATAGDVNGDGYSDVVVGADLVSDGELAEGRAYLFLGTAAGLSTEPSWVVESDLPGAYFGVSVGTAGDVNGDGYSDVFVAAYRATNGEPEEGLVFVYHGSPGGLSLTPNWVGEGSQPGAWYGFCAGAAGDVNGDGWWDLVVGAADHDGPAGTDAGRVYLYNGTPTGLSSSPSWVIDCDQAYAKFGVWVGTAGDANGDGYSDVIVSAYQYDNGSSNEGRAYLYLGSAGGLATAPAWTAESNQANTWFGFPIGTVGDVNGDGYSDVIVGAPFFDAGQVDEGRAFLYQGLPSGLSPSPVWTGEGNQFIASFGFGAAGAGDVNADGFSDVVVGAQHYSNGQSEEGRAYLYLGSGAGLSTTPIWTTESNQAYAFLGASVGTAGDVNGDSFSDVIVASYYYDAGGMIDAGRADLFLGNAGGGLTRLAGQEYPIWSTPIWPLGRTDVEIGFTLSLTGRSPAGRALVRLQHEIKELGVPFDGFGTATGPWTDTGPPNENGSSVELAASLANLTPVTLYRWRVRALTDSPLFPRSPWCWQPYNAVTEGDVRLAELGSRAPDGVGSGEHLALHAAPNPLNGRLTLTYSTRCPGRVRLAVYDVSGREIAVVVDREEEAGLHRLRWDAMDRSGRMLPAGVYWARLCSGGEARVTRIVVRP